MKKVLILFVLISVVSFGQIPIQKTTELLRHKISSSSNDAKILVWVFFKDKGTSLSKFYFNPESVVSEKSLKRRAKVMDKSSLIDFSDLPVSISYVEQLQSIGFEVAHKSKWFNGVSGYIKKNMVNGITKLSFVAGMDIVYQFQKRKGIEEDINLNKMITPNELEQIYSYNYGSSLNQNQQINVPALHDQGIKGQGITICVMDAGFSNLAHESFATMNIIAKWDFVNHDPNVGNQSDSGEGSHGTNTLSTIGGFKEGQLIGPAFMSNYILAKTENTDSETPIEENNWIAAAEWADSIGVDVTSTSLGYIDFDPPWISYTWASMNGNTCRITIAADLLVKKGVVVVNSAGNEGDNSTHNTLGAPADGDSVISIGAVGSSGTRSSFSSVGPTVDGRIKPDVMAMGSGVRVASSSNVTGYTTASGTSFSCPLAAGVAALILCKNPNLTPMQVRDAMRLTGSRSTNPDKYYGWGILNALNAANYWPLPVELVSFTGMNSNGKVFLNWTTATEQNNFGFEVQRKTGNMEFQAIGFVNGKGTSVTENKYSYTDNGSNSGISVYRLKQIDLNGEFKYSSEITIDNSIPADYSLYQNYPNPFNPSTTVRYSVPLNSHIKLTVYSILGTEIQTLFDGEKEAGIHEINFDGTGLTSGVYFLKLSSGNQQQIIKMTLTK